VEGAGSQNEASRVEASGSWLAAADPAKGEYLGRFFPEDKGQISTSINYYYW